MRPRSTLDGMSEPLSCARHPSVETRLRCSACDDPICTECGREAAVGYKCPACARHLDGTTELRGSARAASGGALERFSAGVNRRAGRGSEGGSAAGGGSGRLAVRVGARATVVGIAATVLGGLVLAPVLQGGFFFLLSAGAIGWGVARAVYWGSQERNSPYVRAIAMTLAGFTVAIGMAFAGLGTAPGGIVFLAYPAAVYGGWLVVRAR